MKNLLVTGGCGFIGANFVNLFSENHNKNIFVIDSLTYASNFDNIKGLVESNKVQFNKIDIRDYQKLDDFFSKNRIDEIINFAAESHVDRSIENPKLFLETNIFGTYNLLNLALKNHISKFLQVSTDEVYGSLGNDGYFTEQTQINPNSPYSASKAAADGLVRSYNETYGLFTIITRCSNNYGPFQDIEKLIPKCIFNAINEIKIPIYGKGDNVRDWIYVTDHCEGIMEALNNSAEGQIYNFGGGYELSNIDLVKIILSEINKSPNLMEFVKDRLGHDFRYAIDFSKASNDLGWKPKVSFNEGIIKTINWYKDNLIES